MPSNSLNQTAYNNVLFFSNTLLDASIARELGIAHADSNTRALYADWKSCHFQLNKWYEKPIADRNDSTARAIIADLEGRANLYEKELVKRSPAFAESRREVRWEDVRDRLRPNEVAVEFINYRWHNGLEATDSVMYSALVLHPGDSAPAFVPLFEEKDLKRRLDQACKPDIGFINNLYGSKGSLYDLIWEPLQKALAPTDTTIYFAPSGELHKIAFDAIPNKNSDGVLGDRFRLVRLGSTRQLVTKNTAPVSPRSNTAIVFGGINYDADSLSLVSSTDMAKSELATSLNDLPLDKMRGSDMRGSACDTVQTPFIYLKDTRIEAEKVTKTLRKAGFNIKRPIMGAAATEDLFRQIGQADSTSNIKITAPRVLHIATHGFFFSNPERPKTNGFLDGQTPPFRYHEQPMMRGGLAFSGANKKWMSNRGYKGLEDGILTAYEVSHMNLEGNELAVLSACETSLGEISGSEGVYGLQRAFKIAGSERLIMSLWSVESKSTREFFDQFYDYWLTEKMSIPDAFRQTQKVMRKLYRNEPMKWAGFILIE